MCPFNNVSDLEVPPSFAQWCTTTRVTNTGVYRMYVFAVGLNRTPRAHASQLHIALIFPRRCDKQSTECFDVSSARIQRAAPDSASPEKDGDVTM